MKRAVFFILGLFLFASISACSDKQIDINSASLEKLDELYGIGPAKAQAIVDARPYNSVDDLINAKGIGDATLEKIKKQGLACVEEDDEEGSDLEGLYEYASITGVVEENPITLEDRDNLIEKNNTKEKTKSKLTSKSIINISTEDIKSSESFEKSDTTNYNTVYILIIFCLLVGCLYLIKIIRDKKYQQNEFSKPRSEGNQRYFNN